MNQTTNLGLNKPELSDAFGLDAFNENADKLDTVIKSLQTKTTYKIGDIIAAVKAPDDTWMPCDGSVLTKHNAFEYIMSANRQSLRDQNPEYLERFIKGVFTIPTTIYLNNDNVFACDDKVDGYTAVYDSSKNGIVFSKDGFLTVTTATAAGNNIYYVNNHWISIATNGTLYYKYDVTDSWQNVSLKSCYSISSITLNKILAVMYSDNNYYIIAITNKTTAQVICVSLTSDFTSPALVYEDSIGNDASEISYSECIQVFRTNAKHPAFCIAFKDNKATSIKFFNNISSGYYPDNISRAFSRITDGTFSNKMLPTMMYYDSNYYAICPYYKDGKICLAITDNSEVINTGIDITLGDYVRIFPFQKKNLFGEDRKNFTTFLILTGSGSKVKLYYTSSIYESNSWIEIELKTHIDNLDKNSVTVILNFMPTVWWDNEGVCFTIGVKSGTSTIQSYFKLHYLTTPAMNSVFNSNLFWVKVKD